MFHADGRTDMAKLTVAFRTFANAPKNQSVNVVQGNNSCSLELSWRVKEQPCLDNERMTANKVTRIHNPGICSRWVVKFRMVPL